MTEGTNRRRFSRVNFPANVEFTVNQHTVAARLIDISINGVLVEPSVQFKIEMGATARMVLSLSEHEQIDMQLHVVHQHQGCYGCECVSIDIDSLTHLRQLVAYNMDNPELLERQVADLVHRQNS
jgi:c-di-GMP-binding flagellar brake protein YcgR